MLAGLTASHAGALLTRQLDLLIGADELEEVEGLERAPILTEPYVLIMPAGTPRPERLEELAILAKACPSCAIPPVPRPAWKWSAICAA